MIILAIVTLLKEKIKSNSDHNQSSVCTAFNFSLNIFNSYNGYDWKFKSTRFCDNLLFNLLRTSVGKKKIFYLKKAALQKYIKEVLIQSETK